MGPINAENMPNMSLSAIRKKYPLGDRFALACYCCKPAQTPAEILREVPPMLEFKEEFKMPY